MQAMRSGNDRLPRSYYLLEDFYCSFMHVEVCVAVERESGTRGRSVPLPAPSRPTPPRPAAPHDTAVRGISDVSSLCCHPDFDHTLFTFSRFLHRIRLSPLLFCFFFLFFLNLLLSLGSAFLLSSLFIPALSIYSSFPPVSFSSPFGG